MKRDIVERLKSIEKSNEAMGAFAFANTSSWIVVKNLLLQQELSEVSDVYPHKRQLLSVAGIVFILRSLAYYILAILNRKSRNLFLGASSGLFEHNGEVLDSYLPYGEIKPENIIYMLNSGDFQHLHKMSPYFRKYHIVMDNFLVGPFKVILSKLLLPIFLARGNSALDRAFALLKKDFSISKRQLYEAHYRFIAGVLCFKVFFLLLPIRRAYVVSAYTKSDMVSALLSLGIEVTEVQHGFVGRSHVGYNYACPQGILPTPQCVFVYNDFWKDELIRAGYYRADQIRVTGRLKYDLVAGREQSGEKNLIVFTGQGAYYPEIALFLKKAQPVLEAHGLSLIYKAHPREPEADLAALERELDSLTKVAIYRGKESTEYLIKSALAHISVFSSCHFDAIHYLGKTFIFDVMEDNFMNPYCNEYPDRYVKIKRVDEVVEGANHHD